MYVPTFSVSNKPMYTGNWKQHRKLTEWKLKVILRTGGHCHDRDRLDGQLDLVKAHGLNILLKCSGTKVVNANAAVIIQFQVLGFWWDEWSLFSHYLQTKEDNTATLYCLPVFWWFPSHEHRDNIQLSAAAPRMTAAASQSFTEICGMFISEK